MALGGPVDVLLGLRVGRPLLHLAARLAAQPHLATSAFFFSGSSRGSPRRRRRAASPTAASFDVDRTLHDLAGAEEADAHQPVLVLRRAHLARPPREADQLRPHLVVAAEVVVDERHLGRLGRRLPEGLRRGRVRPVEDAGDLGVERHIRCWTSRRRERRAVALRRRVAVGGSGKGRGSTSMATSVIWRASRRVRRRGSRPDRVRAPACPRRRRLAARSQAAVAGGDDDPPPIAAESSAAMRARNAPGPRVQRTSGARISSRMPGGLSRRAWRKLRNAQHGWSF